MSQRSVVQDVIGAIRTHGLWEPGMSVAVAVSGGGDSVALLALLAETQGLHGAERLEVVTVDHGLHPDSASWAAYVETRAHVLGIPCTTVRLELAPGSSEADARSARYAAFEALEADRVALAHHARDQAETVLLNLLRGTGPRGLGGMAWRRDRYVRPLLGVSPEALASWRPTDAVNDPANADPRHLRVRVRSELLPWMEGARTGSVVALARSAGLAREDDDLLASLARELPLTTSALASAPRPLARRRLELAIGPSSTGVLEAALACIARGTGRVALDGAWDLVVTGDAVLKLPRGDAGPRTR